MAEKLGTQLAIQQIDKSLEKTRMNEFTKAILSTVSSAGIQAVGESISEGIGSFASQIGETLGIRGPPTNAPRLLQPTDRELGSYFLGEDGKEKFLNFGITEGDPFGLGPLNPEDFSDSSFAQNLFGAGFENSGVSFGYDLDENGIPTFARYLGTRTPELTFAIDSSNPDRVSFSDDDANRFESRIDPSTGRYRAPQQIGNLPEIRPSNGLLPFDASLEAIKGPFSAAWINRYIKVAQGTAALGVRLEKFTRPVVNELGEVIGQREYTKVFGPKAAREAAGFKPNANVFKSTTQAVAKYTDVVTAARVAAKNALIVGVAINVIDDVTVGIANGQSRSQIASNVIIDSGITLLSNVIGAIAGVAALPTSPGGSILASVVVSYFFSEFVLKPIVDQLGLRNKLTNLINQVESVFNQSKSAIDFSDDRLLFDATRWDAMRKYYGFF